MVRNRLTAVCVGMVVLVGLSGAAYGQTSGTDSLTGLSPDTLDLINQLLGQNGLSNIADLLGGTTADTSQPSTDDRVGPPSLMINMAIKQHQSFNGVAFGMTPAERREALGIQPGNNQPLFRIPLSMVLQAFLDILSGKTSLADMLQGLFGSLFGPGDGGDQVEPPPGKTGEGIVVILTADDDQLRVGEQTTVRLWVQQSSPNEQRDNGIFSVAVDIDAAPAGVVQSQVPVTILSPWDKSSVAVSTGTATQAGGIQKVTAGLEAMSTQKNLGIGDPVEIFHFTVKALAAGTATLTPANYVGGGFLGVIDWASQKGDQSKYVAVEITVTQ